MTDHHDELASAYLDGLLSADDAARVENDPQLLAEVDALAAVVERLQTEEAPVDAGTRQRHLSSAMAAFDQSTAPTNVIPLDSAVGRSAAGDEPTRVYPQPDDMARRTAKVASATVGRGEARHLETRRRQGLPRWLNAAAALLVIGGGIGWFVSRQDQDTDTAAVSLDAATTADRTAPGAGNDDDPLSQAAESGTDATTAGDVTASDAAKDGAEGSAAGATAEAQPVLPAPAGSSTGGSSPPSTAAVPPSTATSRAVTTAAPSPTDPLSTTTAQSGVLVFGSVPTGADVQSRLAANGGSPKPAGSSSCGVAVAAPAGTTLTGYVPITVNGVAGEGLFYRAGTGSGATTVLVVRTSSCQSFS